MLILLISTLASAAELEMFDLHATGAAGVNVGMVGLSAASGGATLNGRIGWVGLPELEIDVRPTFAAMNGPVFLAQGELWLGWSIPVNTTRRVTPTASYWAMSTLDAQDWGVGITGGIAWSIYGKHHYDAFVGFQSTAWGHTGIGLPRVRFRYYFDSNLFVGTDLCPANMVLQVGGAIRTTRR